MAEPAVLPAGEGPRGSNGHVREDDDLASLRSVLVGPEQRQLRDLQERLDDPATLARDVGAILPQAVLLRAPDPELARALARPVEHAITASVRRNPTPLAEALFPVIGPAIRKAVAASLAAMVESLNRALEQSLSWRAIKWRVTALRTGKSFGEIVLLNTLLYRVEQVFLIDRASGLLLLHVHTGPVDVQDADMVSGMLTAIRDFVRDSFGGSEQDSLDALRVGELSVWIEQGPRAVVAAVIRGNAPHDLRRILQDALDTIHLEHADALDSFDGDTSPFETSRPTLEACLQAQYRTDGTPRSRAFWIVLALAAGAIGLWAVVSSRAQARWTNYVEALRAEPGLVVVSARRSGSRYAVSGLRDPLARDPEAILRQSQIAPEDVSSRWEPYQALDPRFVLARARNVLQPPTGVTLSLRDGTLRAEGDAPTEWVEQSQRIAPLIPGVSRLELAGVLEAEMHALTREIEAIAPLFFRGTSRLVAGQETSVRRLTDHVQRLSGLAQATRRRFRIEIVGHTDADGPADTNLPLSRARAERVRESLGVEPSGIELATVGLGSAEPASRGDLDIDKQRNRRVTLRVVSIGAAPAAAARR